MMSISKIRGADEYAIEAHGVTDWVAAKSRLGAVEKYYERKLSQRAQAAEDKAEEIAAALAVIGAALRGEGYATLGGYGASGGRISALVAISLAETMGYVAETHTLDNVRYLRVAPDRPELDRIKGRMDRSH